MDDRTDTRPEGTDFIRAIVAEDLRTDKHRGRVVTRFPPEPNGFLHVGHAKSICLNFGIAEETGGICHLRFDDTNPLTESVDYVEAIKRDVRWLGYDWGDKLFHASDYFERLHDYAVVLIKKGRAYVDSLSEQEIRELRGTVTEPGTESPFRSRPVEENLDLFRRMRAGEFPDGAHVLRAKIDMAHPNMLMRDPLLYRIRHAHHYRTGDSWCIYPLYDFTHCLSDSIENITHSLCTLEFENNRELYDWILEEVEVPQPQPRQIEFARLNLDYTVVSKRRLLLLVRDGHVSGWDDPRMPTIAGLRRRGVRPEAIRQFADMIGVAKADSRVDIGKLEYAVRDDLNRVAPRVMCVLRPLRMVITDYPEAAVEELDAPYYPRDLALEGSRKVPFSRVLYMERDDFREDPPDGFFRLAPGREVRLRYAYIVKCEGFEKDPATGEVVEVRCTYDPGSHGGDTRDGRKVKGTIHWVSADHSLPAEVRLYDRLFRTPDPEEVEVGDDFTQNLNRTSLVVLGESRIEPSVAGDPADLRYQFERLGYFWQDAEDSSPDRLVFNRIVSLRDTWAKVQSRREAGPGRLEGSAAAGRRDSRAAQVVEGPTQRPTSGSAEAPPEVRASAAETAARVSRYTEELGLEGGQAMLLAQDGPIATFFEDTVTSGAPPGEAAKWIINELPRVLEGREPSELPFGGREMAALLSLVEGHTVSGRAAREVLEEMAVSGGEPREIVAKRGLEKITDEAALRALVDRLLSDYPDKVEQYRSGKTGLIGFFVGQIMRETGGSADPRLARELVENALA
jgi:glutaminyl-tRNA synthetase